MSSVLLDTHTLVWYVEDNPKLSNTATSVIEDPSTHCIFSVASVWEMSIKLGLGKLSLKQVTLQEFLRVADRYQVELLPIQGADAIAVGSLLLEQHKDPFDRMIAAQCLRYDLAIVSADDQFDQYGVQRIW